MQDKTKQACLKVLEKSGPSRREKELLADVRDAEYALNSAKDDDETNEAVAQMAYAEKRLDAYYKRKEKRGNK